MPERAHVRDDTTLYLIWCGNKPGCHARPNASRVSLQTVGLAMIERG